MTYNEENNIRTNALQHKDIVVVNHEDTDIRICVLNHKDTNNEENSIRREHSNNEESVSC